MIAARYGCLTDRVERLTSRRIVLVPIAAAVLLAATGWAQAQSDSENAAQPAQFEAAVLSRPVELRVALNLQSVQAEMQRVKESSELDQDAKATQLEVFRKVLQELEAADRWKSEADKFNAAIEATPARHEEVKQLLSQPKQLTAPPIEPQISLQQLEQMLLTREAELEELRKQRVQIEGAAGARPERRIEIPKRQAEIKRRLEEFGKQITALPPADTELAQANRSLLLSRRKSIENELAALEAELKSYEATAELLPLERELIGRKILEWEARVKDLREEVNRRREAEAQRQVRESRESVANAHPRLRAFAEKNAELADRRTRLTADIEQLTYALEIENSRLKDLREEFRRTTERLTRAGVNTAIGSLLHKQRNELPDLRVYRRRIGERQDLLAKIQLSTFELEDQLARLDDLEAELDGIVQSLVKSNPAKFELIEEASDALLARRREFYESLLGDYSSYLRNLVELDTTEREIIVKTEEFHEFIDEHVLWIASTSPLGLSEISDFAGAFRWLTSPKSWMGVLQSIAADFHHDPLTWAWGLVAMVGLLLLKRRLRARILEIGRLPPNRRLDQFRPTITVLFYTILLAFPWPAAMAFFGWRISMSPAATEFTLALGNGLVRSSVLFLNLELIRQVCRSGGLAETHFGWWARGVLRLRNQAYLFMVLGVPISVLVVVFSTQSDEGWENSLGRVAFLLGVLLLARVLHNVLSPTNGALNETLARNRDGWLNRTRYLWYNVGIMGPLVLAVLAVAGYFYTARQLSGRLFATACFTLGVIMLHALLLRLLLIAKRKLAIKQSRERREALQSESSRPSELSEGEGNSVTVEQPQLDISAVSDQSRRIVRSSTLLIAAVGIYAIWVSALPALRFFEEITLWTTEGGNAITLHNLALTVIASILTVIAVKNVPGLLEITILQRLPLDAGARYAITTVSRYLITIVGVMMAFEQVGVGWSKLQWLLAAMSLGLGFGLQEIFANFVSGLILLLERPIRVGDIVTVDNVTGVISRIRMRATTITDWDRKEFIVPNKEFITGRLLNWTLSDKINRIMVNVGIAYGSDTDRAKAELLRIAAEHPLVLADPIPVATFEGFGDSTLNYVLRCYLPNLENRLAVIHDLHSTIHRRFAELGIEIAFPQRDLHVRTMQPLAAALNLGDNENDKAA